MLVTNPENKTGLFEAMRGSYNLWSAAGSIDVAGFDSHQYVSVHSEDVPQIPCQILGSDKASFENVVACDNRTTFVVGLDLFRDGSPYAHESHLEEVDNNSYFVVGSMWVKPFVFHRPELEKADYDMEECLKALESKRKLEILTPESIASVIGGLASMDEIVLQMIRNKV